MTNTIPRMVLAKPPKKNHYWYLWTLLTLIVIGLLWVGTMKAIDFTQKYEIKKQAMVIPPQFHWPLKVEERKEQVKEVVIQPATPEEVNTPIKKYACDKWAKETKTDAYCLTLIAVFQAESGWNNGDDSLHNNSNGSWDFGIAQINSVNWKLEGCSLHFIVDPIKNIDCAYKIWDRADGVEGNGKGSFEPWVVYNTNSYLANL